MFSLSKRTCGAGPARPALHSFPQVAAGKPLQGASSTFSVHSVSGPYEANRSAQEFLSASLHLSQAPVAAVNP